MAELKEEFEKCLQTLDDNRKEIMRQIFSEIEMNIPKGFVPSVQYKMISFVVPKELYPKGYHVNPELPLPFISIASQKNYVSIYHMGIYGKKELMDWLVNELEKAKIKIDIGKSCIRFNPNKEIPYKVIGKLCTLMTAEEYIKRYELNLKAAKKA
jgi:hypothetical protein